jgi:hypothetical protein
MTFYLNGYPQISDLRSAHENFRAGEPVSRFVRVQQTHAIPSATDFSSIAYYHPPGLKLELPPSYPVDTTREKWNHSMARIMARSYPAKAGNP